MYIYLILLRFKSMHCWNSGAFMPFDIFLYINYLTEADTAMLQMEIDHQTN